MGNVFAYMRISTKEERGKQKFTRQEKAIDNYAEKNGIQYLMRFQEDKSGGNFHERNQWLTLEKLVQSGDCIVFKDICRFSREAENGYMKYMELLEKGVDLIFIDNPTVSTPYIKQLMGVAAEQNLVARVSLEGTIKLLLIVELDRAEQERLTIKQRTKDGIAASPNKQGRKVGQLDKLTDSLKADIVLYNKREMIGTEIMKKHNISRNTLKKYAERIKAQN